MADKAQSPDLASFRNSIKQIVSRISRIDIAELQDHVKVREELDIDSLMSMEIIAACEKQLNLRIDETIAADAVTVGDFLELMEKIRRSQMR
jgi:acyl carrier protein